MILAIDPGNSQSGFVIVEFDKIMSSGVVSNSEMLDMIEYHAERFDGGFNAIAIEWIQSMGMTVGKEVFETCMWVGRFAQAADCPVRLIPRGKIKLHHCGQARAKDANIVQAIKDKYGDKGTKREPGYFYGMKSHAWQAFAVAAYVMEGATDPAEIIINDNAGVDAPAHD